MPGRHPPLNPRQERFIVEYLKDLNATQAAIRAGYAKKDADVQGPRLLGHVGIKAKIAALANKQLATAELSATRILEELRRLATVDLRSFFDAQGNLKPLAELTPEQGACLASFEVIKKNAAAGDGVVDTVHKFKVWDKTRALEMLAKHFALLTEVVQVKAEAELVALLQSARRRTDGPVSG